MVDSRPWFLIFIFTPKCILGKIEHYNALELEPTKFNQSQQCITNNEIPWRSVNFVYLPGVLGLHTEVDHFYEYVQLTPTERALRKRVITKVEFVVKKALAQAQVQPFGSTVSGLSLPNSDIDLLITGVSDKSSSIRLLAAEILASGIVEPNSFKIKDYKIVPIIKFIERESKLWIDLPFGNESALKFSEIVNGFQRKYPDLSKLLMVLKQYLKQRNLNHDSTGIQSYALTLMCISFFQLHHTYKSNEDANVGELLLNFLDVYGRRFDYEHFGISIRNGGSEKPRTLLPCQQQQVFCIEDPINIELNACTNAKRAFEVKQAFYDAYINLSTAIYSHQNNTNDCTQRSTLRSIIYMPDEFVNYRKWVQNNFTHILLKNIMQ